jgi:hypothetical protein
MFDVNVVGLPAGLGAATLALGACSVATGESTVEGAAAGVATADGDDDPAAHAATTSTTAKGAAMRTIRAMCASRLLVSDVRAIRFSISILLIA